MNIDHILNEIISKGGIAQSAAYTGVAVSTYSIFGHTLQEWVYVATLFALVFGVICNAIKTRAITKAAKKSIEDVKKEEGGDYE